MWFITPAVNSNVVYKQGVMYTVRYSALQPLVGGEVCCGRFKKCLVYELLMWPIKGVIYSSGLSFAVVATGEIAGKVYFLLCPEEWSTLRR